MQIIDRTFYLKHHTRGDYGRDATHRPARLFEDDPAYIDVWYVVDDEHRAATVYACDNLPNIKILHWLSSGTFTVSRSVEGVHASINADIWYQAQSAAYHYASWDNPYYGM